MNWFDKEMMATTGINVWEHPFPRERGYQVIDQSPFTLLLMRHDLDDGLKESLIGKFLELDDFRLKRVNDGHTKAYAEKYRDFLQSIRVPEEYADRMLNSQYATHFYPASELSDLRTRWTGVAAPA